MALQGNVLEIPQTWDTKGTTWSDATIDAVLDRMRPVESSGRAKVIGKAGEIGLYQIKPQTALQYGVKPGELLDPATNRRVAKRYLSELLQRYHGNMPLALAAYNAGPSRVDKRVIPASTKSYVRRVLEGIGGGLSAAIGEGSASGAEVPIPPGARVGGVASIPSGGAAGKVPIPAGATIGGSVKPAKAEPFAVRAAGYLPTVGQFAGEPIGATIGALVPGLGETGVPEYLGAAAGGAAGSAGGAYIENKIRKAYGLPPVSVGTQAAIGGATSAAGGLVPLVPRFRKAAAVARATGKSFSDALKEVTALEGTLERTLGMGSRKAQMLETAPATQTQRAYEAARAADLRELGTAYDNVLKRWATHPTPQTAIRTLNGIAGKKLELAGKPLRKELEEEFAAQPMTVRRVQRLIGYVKAKQRALNPDTQAVARSAYDDVIKALERDRDAVIGPNAAAQIKNIDYHYARKLAQFPIKAVRRAHEMPAAAEEILRHKAGDAGRVLEVIRDMDRTGNIDSLRRATSVRLFQKIAQGAARNPAEQIKAAQKAIESVEPAVFDALYGRGARETYLATAESLLEKHGELLKNPTQAAAIAKGVRKYLESPGMLTVWSHTAAHRVGVGLILMGVGHEFGFKEAAYAGSALLGIEGYEIVAHSPVAVRLLGMAARSKDAQAATRLIIAAVNVAARTAGEKFMDSGEAPAAAAGGIR